METPNRPGRPWPHCGANGSGWRQHGARRASLLGPLLHLARQLPQRRRRFHAVQFVIAEFVEYITNAAGRRLLRSFRRSDRGRAMNSEHIRALAARAGVPEKEREALDAVLRQDDEQAANHAIWQAGRQQQHQQRFLTKDFHGDQPTPRPRQQEQWDGYAGLRREMLALVNEEVRAFNDLVGSVDRDTTESNANFIHLKSEIDELKTRIAGLRADNEILRSIIAQINAGGGYAG